MNYRDTFIGIVVALCATVLINLPLWQGVLFQGEWQADTLITESTDETFYLARIREAADGYPWLGHPFLWEQRTARYPLGNLWEALLGGAIRLTGMGIVQISILADALFPFLLALLLWQATKPVLPKKRWRLLLIALVFLGTALPWWKRPISPQAATILPFAYLWALFSAKRAHYTHTAVRSGLIGLMLYSYPYHWTYCLAVEGLLTVRLLLQDTSAMQRLRRMVAVILPLGIIALPWLLLNLSVREVETYGQLVRRLGLISRRLPTAPHIQLWLLGTGICVWYTAAREQAARHAKEAIVLLLLAGLIALNQVLLTGKEAEFSSHYRPMIVVSIWIALLWCAQQRMQKYPRLASGGIAIILCIVAVQTLQIEREQITAYQGYRQNVSEREEIGSAMETLRSLPPQQVILTSDVLGRNLTLYTSHYPFFVFETHMYMVDESLLWTRAAVQQMLFPEHRIPLRALIGTSMMNAALYQKTLCRLLNLVGEKTCGGAEPNGSLLVKRWADLEKTQMEPTEVLRILREAHVSYALGKSLPNWLLAAGSVRTAEPFMLVHFAWDEENR